MNTDRRPLVDPDPLTIILAVMSAASLAVSAANYAKTHLRPLPSRLRMEILGLLTEMEDETRHLRTNLTSLREIFGRSDFSIPNAVRVGRSAFLKPADFLMYERVSDDVYRRLRELNRIGVRLEKQIARLGTLESGPTTNLLGKAYSRLEELLDAKKLSSPDAWERLQEVMDIAAEALEEVRRQLEADDSKPAT